MLSKRIKSMYQLQLVTQLTSTIVLCVSLWGLMEVVSLRGQPLKLCEEPVVFLYGTPDEGEVDGPSSEIPAENSKVQPSPLGSLGSRTWETFQNAKSQ